MVDRHAQQPARAPLNLDQVVAEPADSGFDVGVLTHGGGKRCLRLREGVDGRQMLQKGLEKAISQKKWAGRSAPLDAIWENRNCIKSRD